VSACGDLGNSRPMKQEPVSRATGRTPRKGILLLQEGEEVNRSAADFETRNSGASWRIVKFVRQ
jgi:hypothetical protein